MKKIIILLVILGLLFVGGLFMAPKFISNSLIEKTLKKQTGMNIKIKGDASISLFPNVIFSADGIIIKAYNGKRPLLSSGKIKAEIELSKLLLGNIYINNFSWNSPAIYLEVSKKGVPNWLPKRKSRHSKKVDTSFFSGIYQAKIKNISVVYNNIKEQQKRNITNGIFTILPPKNRTANLKITAKIEGVPVNLSAEFDVKNPAGVPVKSKLLINKINEITADGRILEPFNNFSFGGKVTINGETLIADFKKILQLEYLKLENNPFKLSTRVNYEKTNVNLSDFTFNLGDMNMKGLINYKPSKKDFIEVKLKGNQINLNSLGLCNKGSTKNGSQRWSDELIDLTPLQSIESDINLYWKKLSCNNFTFEPAVIRGRVNKEGILLDEVKLSQTTGGSISLKGKFNDGDIIKGKLQLRLDNFLLEQVISSKVSKFITASINSTSDMEFAGKSIKQWVNNLKGRTRFTAKNGTIKGVDLNNIFASTMNIIMGKNFSEGFNYNIESFAGKFNIDKGIIQSTKMELDVQDILIKGKGKISLPDWTISYAIDTKNRGKLIPTVHIKGALDKPKVTTDIAKKAIATGVGAAIGGPLGAAIGATIGEVIENNADNEGIRKVDSKPEIKEKPKKSPLPFDLMDKDNLKENVRKFLRGEFKE